MQNSMLGNIIPPQMMNNIKGMATQAIGSMKQMGQMATEAETIMTLVNAYKSGNLAPVLQQMSQQNPQMQQALGMLQGKDAQQLKQMAQNMAADYSASSFLLCVFFAVSSARSASRSASVAYFGCSSGGEYKKSISSVEPLAGLNLLK